MEPAGGGWQFSDNLIKVIYLTSLQVSTVRDSSISTIWPAVGDAALNMAMDESLTGDAFWFSLMKINLIMRA